MAEKNKSIGALWQKSGSYGDYFSGSIEIDGVIHKVIVFKNQQKKTDTHPDWKIFPQIKRVEETSKPKMVFSKLDSPDDDDSDIGF